MYTPEQAETLSNGHHHSPDVYRFADEPLPVLSNGRMGIDPPAEARPRIFKVLAEERSRAEEASKPRRGRNNVQRASCHCVCYASPVGDPAERIPTFEELYQAIEALPEGLVGEILEPGVIRTMSRPGAAHRYAARRIGSAFGDDDAATGGGRWWFEAEAEIRLADRLLVPDVAAWRLDEGAPVPPAFILTNPIETAPHWCCEILSPRTGREDRETKLPLYARFGVQWTWLVEPVARRIDVFSNVNGAATLAETVEGMVEPRRIRPFDTLVDVRSWWLPTNPSKDSSPC